MLPDSLTTERLRLRPVEASDASAIFDGYARDAEVTRHLVWRPHRTVADTEAYLDVCRAMPPGAERVYAILSRGGGLLMGCLHLRRPAPHRVEVGYVLARRFWGGGLMTEALRAAVDWAMAQPDLFRVGATCDVDNLASARVMEKAGLVREGVLRRWIVHPNVSHEPRDCFSYARVR